MVVVIDDWRTSFAAVQQFDLTHVVVMQVIGYPNAAKVVAQQARAGVVVVAGQQLSRHRDRETGRFAAC